MTSRLLTLLRELRAEIGPMPERGPGEPIPLEVSAWCHLECCIEDFENSRHVKLTAKQRASVALAAMEWALDDAEDEWIFAADILEGWAADAAGHDDPGQAPHQAI